MKAGGSALEYTIAIAPNDDSSLRYEKELRVKFLQPRKRFLMVMIDKVNGALGRLLRNCTEPNLIVKSSKHCC